MFTKWVAGLRDIAARARIAARLSRLEDGNPGDVRAVGEGISEMRLSYGPGYRLYYVQTGKTVVVLLCGGDKSSQTADITKAKQLAKEI